MTFSAFEVHAQQSFDVTSEPLLMQMPELLLSVVSPCSLGTSGQLLSPEFCPPEAATRWVCPLLSPVSTLHSS